MVLALLAVLLLPQDAPLAGEIGFELLTRATEPVARPLALDRLHDALVLERDRLWRVGEGGVRGELRCSDEGGTGAIRAVDEDPGGTLYLACAGGLFNLCPAVDRLDRIALSDGAPPGEPVGVVVEDSRRLWLATREAFGCLDTRFFFGRTFSVSDGIPAPPYRGLRSGAGGALELETEDGVFRYRPARRAGPTLRVVSVNGLPFETGRLYELDARGAVAFELEGSALGGASFRYRAKHHHLLKRLHPEAPRVEGLEPGVHELVLSAWDRELRRSPPVAVTVRVAYPRAFDKRVLVPLALAGLALVTLAFLLRARRRGGGRVRYAKALLSAVLSVMVALQLLAALIPHGRSWPFVGFSMYTEFYARGSVTYRMRLVGVQEDGRRFRIERFDAGYGLYELRRTLAELIHGSEADREAFLAALRKSHRPRKLDGFLILDERRRLTPHGPVSVAPTVLCVYPEGLLE